MDDQKLLALSEEEFNELVGQAFSDYRYGDILALSNSPLAQSSLTVPCFLEGESVTPALRGRVMGSVLCWVVETVRPSGEQNWVAFEWRSYNILDGSYIQGKRVAELAELMGIAHQTYHQSRNRAIKVVGKRLRAELERPQAVQERQHQALADRYASLSSDEQLILRIVPIFGDPIPTRLLHQLASEAKVTNIQEGISNFFVASLLQSNERQTECWVPAPIQPYLLTLSSPKERAQWHEAAGEHYEQQHAYLEAAHHFQEAGEHEVAAQILITHYQAIVDSNQVADLRPLLEKINRAEVDNNRWSHLQVVAGRAAEFMGDTQEALQKYEQALGAKNVRTKAEAYYRRAKLFEVITSIDEALAHYNVGINLLKRYRSLEPLESRRLIQMYIHRAWIFIQEQPDLDRATADLTHAEELITRGDYLEEWADLHNAWGELLRYQKEPKRGIQYRFEAWVAATELGDIERKIKIGHNLGVDYVITGQYEKALKYLGESRTLAIEVDHRQIVGACNDHIGACYYCLGEYEQARDYYLMAREIHVELEARNRQGHNCYNLAEVSLELGESAQVQSYFEQGLAIAQELKDQRLQREFGRLALQIAQHYIQLADRKQAQRYLDEGLAIAQELKDEKLLGQFKEFRTQMSLSERQRKGVEYVKEHGQISKRQYMEVIAVTEKQARNDLKDLVEKGVFKKVGGGRSTRYELAE